MHMSEGTVSTGGTGLGQRLWPVLLLLVVAVLIPTACVLWFMNEAVRNERLAIRQRLADVYRDNLRTVQADLQILWRERLADLETLNTQGPPSLAFHRAATGNDWDTIIVRSSSGNLYPSLAAGYSAVDQDWEEREDLRVAGTIENELNEPQTAAQVYAEIAQAVDDPPIAARALQGQVRCLLRLDRRPEALEVLCKQLLDERFWQSNDPAVQQIVANSGLMALRMLEDPAHPEYIRIRQRMTAFVNDYRNEHLSSVQRMFLMEELRKTAGPPADFPTLAAERLAAEYLAAPGSPRPRLLSPTGLAEIWSVASLDGNTVALVRERRIKVQAEALLARIGTLAGASVELVPADQIQRTAEHPFLSVPAGDPLVGWELAVALHGPNPFATAAQRRITTYLWIGGLVISITALVAALVARHLGRQVRLTRLKNDLIATVSHELKTPLSSIRALVDTLLARDGEDPQRSREYLQLIARENARLSRLIDNFLAFSRMERNRHTFTFARCQPARIVESVCESVRERFEACRCAFEVQLDSPLPQINVDAEAMATVLINLLDNAYKYTGDEKRINLRVYAEGEQVCFEVCDNGVGLSRRAVRKVFDRFYQADQSLSRRAGGCGLGLSIVQFIVRAHHGQVEVHSKPGQGSTFTVKLPAEPAGRSEVAA